MNRFSRFLAMVLVLVLSAMAIGFAAVGFTENSTRPDLIVFQMAMTAAFGWILLRGPVGRAIANMLEGSHAPDGDTAQLLDELQMRIAQLEQRGMTSGEVEQAYSRLSDVESRLDFTERLLTQVHDAARLQPPAGS